MAATPETARLLSLRRTPALTMATNTPPKPAPMGSTSRTLSHPLQKITTVFIWIKLRMALKKLYSWTVAMQTKSSRNNSEKKGVSSASLIGLTETLHSPHPRRRWTIRGALYGAEWNIRMEKLRSACTSRLVTEDSERTRGISAWLRRPTIWRDSWVNCFLPKSRLWFGVSENREWGESI